MKKYDKKQFFYEKIYRFTPFSTRNMKEKYIFDNEKLTYVLEKHTFAYYCKRCRNYALTALAIGATAWLLTYFNVIPSVQTIKLQKQGEKYIADIQHLDERFADIECFLSEVQSHDDSCYRVISQMQPLSADKRMASFGGSNKYEYLEGYFNSDLFINYNRKVDILTKKLNMQSQSYDAVLHNVRHTCDSLLCVPAILPLQPQTYHLSSDYGYRIHPIKHTKILHDGVDLAAREGSPVYASGNGVVISTAKTNSGYGYQVVVDHGYGYKTRYAHLSKIAVHKGDTISRGTVIGKVGNTGLSTGPHLHYEVITSSGKVNPEKYMVRDMNNAEFKEMISNFNSAD